MDNYNELEIITRLFELYKNTIKFYIDFSNNNNYYHINIESKPIDENNRKIIISIINIRDKDENPTYLPSTFLNNNEAIELINLIRNDFIEEHYILFASYNPNSSIQEINNSMFSLRIQILTEEERELALITNEKVNNHLKRRLCL